MANHRHQPITSYLPGVLVLFLILTITFAALCSLWWQAPKSNVINALTDPYLWHILGFSCYQALLSTLLTLFFAVILSKSFYQRAFRGRSLLIRLYSVTFILPSLVVIDGLMLLYGKQGWLATLAIELGINYHFQLYGLSGILIAHLFYNIPYAFRLFLQSLEQIPTQHFKLSAQLTFSRWQQFKWVEWPVIYPQLFSVGFVVFLLCFASFSVVLVLGGSPKYTTFEVAIYQAVRDYELELAVILSLLQLVGCLCIMLLLQRLTPYYYTPIKEKKTEFLGCPPKITEHIIAIFIISGSLFFILLPLFTIIVDGIYHFHNTFLTKKFFIALFNSLLFSSCSGILALLLSFMLLWSNRLLFFYHYTKLAHTVNSISLLILMIPTMVLSCGLFLLFLPIMEYFWLKMMLLITCNALMSLPFVLKTLEQPMKDITGHYQLLLQSLHLQGINRIKLIEWPLLSAPLRLSLAFAVILSFGDFGIIALIGDDQFMTLPFYLYQQMDSYHQHDAAFTAFVLLLLSIILFFTIDKKNHD